MKLKAYLLVSICTAVIVPHGAFAQIGQESAVPPSGIASEPSRGVADIVVTAQKREQNLQDVPVSISAIDEGAIVANRIQDVTDLSRLTPNLLVREGAGGSRSPVYAMRGIVTAGTAPGSDKGVSLYIDGVYIQNVQGSVFEFADIQRIEVLRGPQGTLFGRNSTGGAVSFITRDPSGEAGLRQEFAAGNLGQFRARTRIDLPQIGPFSVSASYLHSERDGDIRNLGRGTRWDHSLATAGRLGVGVSPSRLGGQNVEGIFVAVKADLHPDLELKYKFDYSENDYTTQAVGLSYLPGSAALAFGGFTPTQVGGSNPSSTVVARLRYLEQDPALRTPISLKRPGAVNNAFSQPGRTVARGHNLTARWVVSDSLALKNILSFRRSKQSLLGYQLDGLGGLTGGFFNALPATSPSNASAFLSPSTPGATAVPILLVGNNGASKDRQWSNEFQVNYDSQLLTLTVGYIHFNNRQTTAGFLEEFNTTQFAPIVGQGTTAAGTSYVIPRNTGFTLAQTEITSDAAYAQPEIHLNEKIDVVAGIRVTHDKKTGREPVPGAAYPFAPSAGRFSSINYKDTRTTYLLGVNYKPNDDLLLYAKYATGYISGGQLATISYEPETAESFEGGIKADLLDRRLRSNLSVFHVKYGQIQTVTLGSLSGVPSAFNFAQALIPSADAKATGFEWENTLVPVSGLTLQGNLGYTDFRYDNDTVFPALAFNSGAGGYVEFGRPKWTLSTSAQYETPPMIAGGRLVFRADASYKSAAVLSSDITPGNGPSAQVDPAYRRGLTAPANWNVNGRMGLQDFEMGTARASLAVFGKNIFNNRDIVSTVGLGFAAAVAYERARTYGFEFAIDF